MAQDFSALFKQLNDIYHPLETKRTEIISVLSHGSFKVSSGFYNGHWRKNELGTYQCDDFPIPVISVSGLCDIEIQPDGITLSTKRKREDALSYSYEKFAAQPFETYGVEDYLTDYRLPGATIGEMKDAIRNSNESEIGFSFRFPFDTEGSFFFEFVKLLRREGFYY